MAGGTPSNVVIDDLNQIRLVEPDLFDDSTNLSSDVTKFIDNVSKFEELTTNVAKMVTELGKVADAQRLKAMNVQNALKESENQQFEKQQQLRILVHEKEVELERLKVELQQLRRVENKQVEYLQRLRTSI